MNDKQANDWNLVPVETDKPRHKHGCKKCQWLATLEHPGSYSKPDPCDVYFCDKDGLSVIVVRYGKGTNVALHNAESPTTYVPEFNEGMRLAREKGMLP